MCGFVQVWGFTPGGSREHKAAEERSRGNQFHRCRNKPKLKKRQLESMGTTRVIQTIALQSAFCPSWQLDLPTSGPPTPKRDIKRFQECSIIEIIGVLAILSCNFLFIWHFQNYRFCILYNMTTRWPLYSSGGVISFTHYSISSNNELANLFLLMYF